MFSFNPPKVSSEFRIAEIDKELFETPVYQYMKRQDLKDERRNLLTRRKAKEKVSEEKEQSVSPEISKNPAFYQPANLYKGYLDHPEDRQKFSKDKENLIRLQIKDKQYSLKKLVKEIEELKRMLEIKIRERDSPLMKKCVEPMSKHYSHQNLMKVQNILNTLVIQKQKTTIMMNYHYSL